MKATLIAAALSVTLHALGMWIFIGSGAPVAVAAAAPASKPVQVEVMRLAGLVPAEKRAVAINPAPRTPLARLAPTRPVAPIEAVAKTNDSARTPDGVPQAPAGDAPTLAAAASGAPGAVEAAGEPEGVEAPSAKGEVGLDTAALSRRLQQVALRCYPAAARRFRQAGEAEVRFCLNGAGGLIESKVLRSSGSELLDAAANECVVPGAAPFGPETHGHCFTVPVRFKL